MKSCEEHLKLSTRNGGQNTVEMFLDYQVLTKDFILTGFILLMLE